MSSDEKYWADRAIKREAYWNKQCREVIEKRLASQYNKTAQSIMKDIAALYGQFAGENGLSIKEATALIRGKEFREWRMSLEEYAALAEKDNAVLKELNTLAMRSRITRLEKLYGDTLKELYKLGKATDKSITAFLGEAYKDNYYKSLYEIGRTAGIQGAISAVNTKALEGVLRTPWSGKNYSERIWDNSKKLADTLKDTMSAGIHRGLSVPKLSKMVQERMGVGRYEATRLVRTELNYVHNQANLDSIKDSGMDFYKFVATLDHRTSQKCRAHDGSIVPVEEASPGDNLPPLHPHCRSTIIGSLGEGKGGQKGTRIARDSKGRTFHVPQQMTYKDYKAVYIDQSKPIAQWAKEAGIAGNLAKYTPKVSSQGNGKDDIIASKGGEGLEQAKKRDRKIMITDVAISKVPCVDVPGLSKSVCQIIQQEHKELLRIAKTLNDSNEVLTLRMINGKRKASIMGGEFDVDPSSSPEACGLFNSAGHRQLMYLHNHPSTNKFSFPDIMEFVRNGPIGLISVVTNQGEVYILYKAENYSFQKASNIFSDIYQRYSRHEIEHNDAVNEFLKRCKEGGIVYARSD